MLEISSSPVLAVMVTKPEISVPQLVKRRRGGHSRASAAFTQISPAAGSSSPDRPASAGSGGTPGAARRSSTSRTWSPNHESAMCSTGTGRVLPSQIQSGISLSTRSACCSIADCIGSRS